MTYINVFTIDITKVEQHYDCSIWSIKDTKDKFSQATAFINKLETFFNKSKICGTNNPVKFDTKSIISADETFMVALVMSVVDNKISEQDAQDIAKATGDSILELGVCLDLIMNNQEMASNYIKIIPSNGQSIQQSPGIITAPKLVAELATITRSLFNPATGLQLDLRIGDTPVAINYNQNLTSLIDDYSIDLCRGRVFSVCDHSLRAKISIDGNSPREVSFEPDTRDELLLAQINREDILVEMNNGFSHHNGEKKLTSSQIIRIRPAEQIPLSI